MSNDLRGYTLTIAGASVDLVTETCYSCGVVFAMTAQYRRTALNDHDKWFHCPNGHKQHYTGKSAEQKLKDAEAREVALKDQLAAAIRDADQTRVQLLRDRERFAKGVCPCCNRSFENVRRHMATQHPDYDAKKVLPEGSTVLRRMYQCSCGREFESVKGLRTHQGHTRPSDWDKPGQYTWRSHLTVV